MNPDDPTWQQLFEHRDFARRLVGSLVRDPGDAQDLLQSAWLGAWLRRGPVRNPRGYLSTVLRRGQGRLARDRSRRQQREESSARPEALPSAADWAEALESQQRLLRALAELPELVREALLLRFYEDMPPRRIARVQGVGVETVRSRIQRGLRRLRTCLDDEDPRGRVHSLACLVGSTRSPWMLALSGRSLVGAVVLGVLVLGLIRGFWGPASGAGGAEGPVVSGAPDPSADPDSDDGDPGSLSVGDPVGRGPGLRNTRPAPESIDEEPGPGGEFLVGEVVMVDPDSKPHSMPQRATSGRFVVSGEGLGPGGSGFGTLEVELRGGRFRLSGQAAEGARGGGLGIHGMRIEGRAAIPLRRDLLVPPSSGADDGHGAAPLRVEAQWRPEVELRVVDDVTGRDLDDLRVYRHVMNAGYGSFPLGLTPGHLHLDGASSPLLLSSLAGRARYWVTAPGYQWADAFIDHGSPGSREVRLRPGGSFVRVDLGGSPVPEGAHVRLHPRASSEDPSGNPSPPIADGPVTGERARIDGVPAGSYDLRVELGTWYGPNWVLAEKAVEVPIGSGLEVSLEFGDDSLPPQPVVLEITLELGGDLEPEELGALRLEPVGQPRLAAGDIRDFNSSELQATPEDPLRLGLPEIRVTPGTYRLTAWDIGFQTVFEVPETGLVDHRIPVPPLGELLLGVRTPEGPLDAQDAVVSWRSLASPGGEAAALRNTPFVGGEGVQRIRAPWGPLELSVRCDGYFEETQRVELGETEQSLELTLRPAPGFWLRLFDGKTPVPLHPAVTIHLTHGGEELRIRGVGPGGRWVQLERSGPVEVRFDPIHGFEDPGSLSTLADLDSGRVLEVPLRRIGR